MNAKDGKAISLPHSVIVKAPGLLPMYYTSKDLVEELGVPSHTIKQWIENGLPYHREERNYIMVNGRDLAKWVEDQRRRKREAKLPEMHSFCLKCKTAVNMVNPVRVSAGKRTLLKGECESCGTTVFRGLGHG
jgi:hypothetical protein